jgi:hypothetical protein
MGEDKPRCKQLRSRLEAILGRDGAASEDSVPNAQYWCAVTTTVLGPDAVYCSARACTSRRPCFEQDE